MHKRILILPLFALALTGCVGGLGGGDYERSETRRAYEVKMGVVESVRSVNLEGTQSGVGMATGAVVGGVVGSEVGEGKGKTLATVIGAVAGGIAGAAAEKGVTKKPGLEITVRLDSGRTLAVVQEDTGERFNVGDRVRVLESGGQTRVTH
ncbi:outer membrane lipoprotein SlyB [Sulfuritortus calidifontis]|uniref:Outer membrane lipoprotein SlyB n=1 Tax=Sulfuritortus calidifontis TaxID=1914471 RepID=A0A4V2UQY4_9PROT|nr:glycine zipper 2TM domain-containing protein [Sulfuritortus calidifontis]TCS73296.1 outer membrane lipoprotein SlyB [Sulfuritortus calidifontis]